MALLRGISRITAAGSALLLIYGISYAMEGMTTRLPETVLHELAFGTLYLLPWMLLFCSGIGDIAIFTRKRWAFWIGSLAGIALLCYLEHYSTDRTLTKIAMPLLVTLCGWLPYFIRSMNFVYAVCSFATGMAGLAVCYFEGSALLSGGAFATKSIGYLIIAFVVSSIVTVVLTAGTFRSTTQSNRS
jgi:hypothetical protein